MPGSFLLGRLVSLIEHAVGPHWHVRLVSSGRSERREAEGLVELAPPTGSAVQLSVVILTSAYPRDVVAWLGEREDTAAGERQLVASTYLSPRARALLDEAEVNYADATGNVRLLLSDPPIVIRDRGIDRNPAASLAAAMTLRGARATRVLRLLCDVVPPHGVRNLAVSADVSPGYVSKLLRLLETEAIVERDQRGLVVGVDWGALLRRWSQDYKLGRMADCEIFSSPSGPAAVLNSLPALRPAGSELRYAVTGAFAADRVLEAGVPSAGALTCYADSPLELAEAAGLVPGGRGADVWLCEARDPVVFAGSWEHDGVRLAAASQVAIDCMGGLDRLRGSETGWWNG